MRALIVLVWWCASLTRCASATSHEDVATKNLCAHVEPSFAMSIHYPSSDALRAAVGGSKVVGEPLCTPFDPRCEHTAAYVYRDADGSGEHSLAVAVANGLEGYPGLFMAGSGACCEWDPEATLVNDGPWSIVRQAGDSYSCEARECNAEGVLVQLAVVERASGRLVFTAQCAHSDSAELALLGDRFMLTDCEGDDIGFTLADALACTQ